MCKFGSLLLLITILTLPAAKSNAQTRDSVVVNIFFRVDEAVVDSSYMGNGTRLRAIKEDYTPRRRMSPRLKTNMLFDIAGAPNVGVEIPLGSRFSAGADVAYARWRINNLYALQTIQGGVNAKYWFRAWDGHEDRALRGWNAGVYAMYCSRYDVQWKDGWQGDGFWSAGASAGYSMPITKRLNLEFVLAAGYFHTPEARHYHRPENGHLMWQETRNNVGRFSITKIQANLVWLLKKQKGR